MHPTKTAGGFRRAFTLACLSVLALSATLTNAASIPVWLDDAIAGFNAENVDIQIEFVDVKDSFVWYVVPETDEIGSERIRESIYGIALANGYKMTADELITTARPPSRTTPSVDKKCWKRSFTLDVDVKSAGRMLNTYVCQDEVQWFAGFRILQ